MLPISVVTIQLHSWGHFNEGRLHVFSINLLTLQAKAFFMKSNRGGFVADFNCSYLTSEMKLRIKVGHFICKEI